MNKVIVPQFQLIDPRRFIGKLTGHLDRSEGQIELLDFHSRTPRKNPFQPAPNSDPKPKGELPSYLSFGKMNIKLKGE